VRNKVFKKKQCEFIYSKRANKANQGKRCVEIIARDENFCKTHRESKKKEQKRKSEKPLKKKKKEVESKKHNTDGSEEDEDELKKDDSEEEDSDEELDKKKRKKELKKKEVLPKGKSYFFPPQKPGPLPVWVPEKQPARDDSEDDSEEGSDIEIDKKALIDEDQFAVDYEEEEGEEDKFVARVNPNIRPMERKKISSKKRTAPC